MKVLGSVGLNKRRISRLNYGHSTMIHLVSTMIEMQKKKMWTVIAALLNVLDIFPLYTAPFCPYLTVQLPALQLKRSCS